MKVWRSHRGIADAFDRPFPRLAAACRAGQPLSSAPAVRDPADGAGGIADAHAAHAIFTGFGRGYRRPLVLLRALMAELSRVSSAQLKVAPCCCPRMTSDEAMLVDLIAEAPLRPSEVHQALRDLLHVKACPGALSSAEAVASAFADLGMPLTDDCSPCNRDGPF